MAKPESVRENETPTFLCSIEIDTKYQQKTEN